MSAATCYKDCPIDWVVCFRSDCPRAAVLKAQLAEQEAQARRILGDPTISVGGRLNPITGLIEPFIDRPNPQPDKERT